MAYRALEGRISSLSRQHDMFASKIVEIQSTIDSINEISAQGKGTKDILFPLGSAAYTKRTVMDKDKLIVEVGAGIALEKTIDKGKAILEKRKKELEQAMGVLQKEMQNISGMMQKIEADAQHMVSRVQKEDEKFRIVPG